MSETAQPLVMVSAGTESLVAMVQIIALFSTIAFYLSGSATCMKIHRQKSAKNVNFLPYMMTCLNCFSWLVYGTLRRDRLLYTVNAIGCFIQIAYIFVFIQNCETKQYYLRRLLTMICFCLFTLSFAYLGDEDYDVISVLGYTCLIITIVMYGSPLSTLREVIRTESSETISVPLTISTLVVTGTWTYYGHLIRDNFVKVPNGLGLFLGVLQLLLVFIYRPVKRPSLLNL